MRLFIAINFDDETKNKITEMQDKLRRSFLHANFTHRENLHMTLHFFGEGFDRRVPAIQQIMDGVSLPGFKLQIQGAGYFRRGHGGDIWWAGVRDNKNLNRLHSDICAGILKEELYNNYERGNFSFKPHITIAREVLTECGFDERIFNRGLKTINTMVEKISLMKSERIGGRLIYTPIHESKLPKSNGH